MQWTGDRNGGFSRADPARLYAPPVMDPVYGYEALNVEAQERAPFSLLNGMKRMIGLRKQMTVFGRGTIEFLPARNRKILPYVRRDGDETVLCVANLARSVQPVELDLARFKGMTPVEMFGLTEFPKIGDQPYFLTLGPYAFYWFKIQQAPTSMTARVAPETATDVPEVPALFVGAAWETVLDGNVRTLIERDLLVPFLSRQRWFGGKSRRCQRARRRHPGQQGRSGRRARAARRTRCARQTTAHLRRPHDGRHLARQSARRTTVTRHVAAADG
jgi:maltose alpha-D-glucosyltransferase/alpha-amylase